MTTKIINNGLRDVTVIVADEEKHFVRKSDGFDFGKTIWLGTKDKASNYDEVDLPEPEEVSNEMDLV